MADAGRMREGDPGGRIEAALDRLLAYGAKREWSGYDPYDALRSPIVSALTFGQKWPRIAWIQLLKRSPVNLRPLLLVSRGVNPKGLGLVARALAFDASGRRGDRRSEVAALLARLDGLRSERATGAAWGYNFDWQSRAFFVPEGTPSIVCTTFVANAYLDAYRRWGEERWRARAREACDFLLADLHRTPGPDDSFCFSYTPLDRTCVHNASMLGAELLARVARETGERELRDAALSATRFTLRAQAADGSWPYGTLEFQSWIDNFHTGFVLTSLDAVVTSCEKPEWLAPLRRGYDFYRTHFFLADGTPKYYHDELYPIDVHSAAQALVTFAAMSHLDSSALDMGRLVARWAIENMSNGDGYFYFQRHRRYTNRTSYIRWSQAWMVYGLARLVAAERGARDVEKEA
jgi:hypothetical protein